MRTMLVAAALALAVPVSCAQTARLILVGDSTMAAKRGYGDALCARFAGACVNLARGGRSSMSFRAEGLWEQVLALLREPDAPRPSYVLIQFGHNDQPGKPGRSTDLVREFPVNLARYVDEVRAAGGVPVLLTPLTRRSFKGPWLRGDLAPWGAATRQVAAAKDVPLLDLLALSEAAVQAMGEAEADTLAMAPKPAPDQPVHPATAAERAGAAHPVFDRTHLGDKGARLFSLLVARELVRLRPELQTRLRTDDR